MDRVRAFNIPVDDMSRAKAFYESVFGWEVWVVSGSGGDYHYAATSPGGEDGEPLRPGSINGGLFSKGTHGIGSIFLELEVPSIDESVAKVLSQGGRLVREKRPMLDFAYFAIVQDPFGNHLGLMEMKKGD